MDTIALTRILTKDPYCCKSLYGVLASNHLPYSVNKLPCCFVVNTDPSWKSGTHWLALYIDENRKVEFFDSYGQKLESYPFLYSFVQRVSTEWKFNNKQLQGSLSSTCGQFCIYFLFWRTRGIRFDKILKSFATSVDTNDILVTSFVNMVSDDKTRIYDVDYVVNQYCKTFIPIGNLF